MKLKFQANFIYKNNGLIYLYLSPSNDSSALSASLSYTCVLKDHGNLISLQHAQFKIKKLG